MDVLPFGHPTKDLLLVRARISSACDMRRTEHLTVSGIGQLQE